MSNVIERIQSRPPMLRPELVAEKLDVTAQTVRNMCERGDIPGALKVGRQWRIPPEYLDGILNSAA